MQKRCQNPKRDIWGCKSRGCVRSTTRKGNSFATRIISRFSIQNFELEDRILMKEGKEDALSLKSLCL